MPHFIDYDIDSYTKENGWKPLKMSRRNHNKIFLKRKMCIVKKVKYFYNEEKQEIVFYRQANFLGKIYTICIFPIAIIAEGVVNTKSIFEEVAGILSDKSGQWDYYFGEEYMSKILPVSKY